ncbi:hypothetical protein GX51_07367 [Blastomyces parvus]|uniref:Uncharacterized protein n=1 Tax=Blastomyces parvus TaxID=2060905 RepID=A0A2B7WD01_9EURO|nr:hypothetical protein GX51_07367 [Blastomyces parvus]
MSTLDENVPSRTPDRPEDPAFTPTIDAQSKDSTNVFPLDGIGLDKVVRISHGLGLKCGPSVLPREVKGLDLVRSKTAIRVPHVYRSFQVDDPNEYYGTRGYLVMDCIEGRDIEIAGDNLLQRIKMM